MGDDTIMAEQLRHLEQLALRPNITLQVLPFSQSDWSPFDMPIHLLTLHDRATIGYTESQQRGFLERDRETVTAWHRDYDQLQAAALSPADSLALIRAVRKDLVNMTDAVGLTGASWLKSSYSGSGGNACVEVAPGFAGVVPVRDSKDPDGPALVFSAEAFAAFVVAVKRGELAR